MRRNKFEEGEGNVCQNTRVWFKAFRLNFLFIDLRSLAEYINPLAKVRKLPHITDAMLQRVFFLSIIAIDGGKRSLA
ncbi:hypothetical protein IL306_006674 [Fusarium sp. DS 682]|nr:hypothetical protein IL306_006674 [Fusarium sp. DS 682]